MLAFTSVDQNSCFLDVLGIKFVYNYAWFLILGGNAKETQDDNCGICTTWQ